MELTLRQIVPGFEVAQTNSDIWASSCTFSSKSRRYLIKAPSGNGKTTFQKILHGTYKTFSGDLLIDDSSLKSMNANELSSYRSEIASFIFQDLRLFHTMTAMENVLVKNELTGLKTNEEILFYFDALGKQYA